MTEERPVVGGCRRARRLRPLGMLMKRSLPEGVGAEPDRLRHGYGEGRRAPGRDKMAGNAGAAHLDV